MSSLLARLRFRLRALMSPDRTARQIDEELDRHLRLHERELVEEGLSPAEARRRAVQELGDLQEIRSHCREIADLPVNRLRKGPIDVLGQDFRYALRTLLRHPGFALLAATTLALGITATTTIFSLVEGVVLRPLPYPDPEQLVVPAPTLIERGNTPIGATYAEFLEWRSETDVFEAVAVATDTSRDLTGDGEPRRLRALATTADYFRVFGVEPLLGRGLEQGDYTATTARVVVLGSSLWQGQFGGALDIVGREIRLSDRPYRVIGVVDEAAVWPRGPEIWLPLYYGDPPPAWVLSWDAHFMRSFARLRDGVDVATAEAYVGSLAARLAADVPQERGQTGATVIPLRDWIVEDNLRTGLYVLLGAVGFVLLIACVNVANLMLARGAERQTEIAVRRALGASRVDLLRQTLAESLLVAVVGGAMGVGGAALLTRLIVSGLPTDTPRLAEVGLSPGVLFFAVAVTVATAFVFGSLPALESGHGGLGESIRSTRGATGGRRVQRTRNALVVAEVVLSLVLLVGAGLMLRSLGALFDRNAGLQLDEVLVADVSLPGARYSQPGDDDRFFLEASERIAALPGVTAAAAAFTLPMRGGGIYREHLREGAPDPPAGPEYFAQWNIVSPDYFRTVGIELRAGRLLDESDAESTEPVMVVSESLARQMFPDESPIGKRIRSWRDENVLRTIVGVVSDVRMAGMDAEYQTMVYVSMLQSDFTPRALLIRTQGEPMDLVGAVREAIWSLDAQLPVDGFATLRQLAAGSVQEISAVGRLMSVFALIALALAATGLYGVVSWSVARRTREYGIRQALGASSGNVVSVVVRGAVRLVGLGVALGLLLAFTLSRLLGSLLYDVDSLDPLTYGAVVAAILATALTASVVPALRATRVDPVESLRSE